MVYEIWKNGKKYDEIYSDGVEYDSIRHHIVGKPQPIKNDLVWAKNFYGKKSLDPYYGYSYSTFSYSPPNSYIYYGMCAYDLKKGDLIFLEYFNSEDYLFFGVSEGIVVIDKQNNRVKFYDLIKKDCVYFQEENIQINCLSGNKASNIYELFSYGNFNINNCIFLIKNDTYYTILKKNNNSRIISIKYNKNIEKIIFNYRDFNTDIGAIMTTSFDSIIAIGKNILNLNNLTLNGSCPFSSVIPAEVENLWNEYGEISYSSLWSDDINYGTLIYNTFRASTPQHDDPYTVGTAFTFFYFKDYNTNEQGMYFIGSGECSKATQIHYIHGNQDAEVTDMITTEYISYEKTYDVNVYFIMEENQIYFLITTKTYKERGNYYDVIITEKGVWVVDNDYKNSHGSLKDQPNTTIRKYYMANSLIDFENKELIDSLPTGIVTAIYDELAFKRIIAKENQKNRFLNATSKGLYACTPSDGLVLIKRQFNSYKIESVQKYEALLKEKHLIKK